MTVTKDEKIKLLERALAISLAMHMIDAEDDYVRNQFGAWAKKILDDAEENSSNLNDKTAEEIIFDVINTEVET